jgi:hypothetical protein
MSFQAWTIEQINTLANAYNTLVALKKKIDDLTEKTTYETGMHVAVYDPTSGSTVKFPFIESVNPSDQNSIEISNNKFTLRKHPSNTNPAALEVNDMICNGWWGTTEFWRLAVYVGGATTNAASWNVIDTIEEIPLN